MSSDYPSPFIETTDRNTTISVSNISKVYQIYERPEDRLKKSIFSHFQKWIGRTPKIYHNDFWALKNVSFKVQKGETVGIIGRNGSGKSTLLRIICGLINPTNGYINLNGKASGLLELGSGFNPDFSGRDNVYINGAILGFSEVEITKNLMIFLNFLRLVNL